MYDNQSDEDKDLDFKDDKTEDSVKEKLWFDRKILAFSALVYAVLLTPFYAIVGEYLPLESFRVLVELGIWTVLGCFSIIGAYMGFKSYFYKGQQ